MAELIVRGLRFNVVQMGPGDDAAGRRPLRRPPPAGGVPARADHGQPRRASSTRSPRRSPATTDVVLYDLRGHGRTERPLDGYRIEDGVDDLVGVLDAVGIDGPVHLVANSFGGTIALAAALRRPDRVAGMVLIEAHPAFEGWGDEMIEDLAGPRRGLRRPRHPRLPRQPARPGRCARWCGPARSWSTETLARRRPAPRPSRPAPRTWPPLSCPSILLYGESSDILDRAFVLEDSIPGTVLEVVDGCSHALLMENPAEVERLTLAWLDRAGRPASRRGRRRPARAATGGGRVSRFLFVVPPLTGHVNPTVPLGHRADRPAATRWRGPGCPASSTACCPPGATFLPVVGALDQAAFDRMQDDGQGPARARGAQVPVGGVHHPAAPWPPPPSCSTPSTAFAPDAAGRRPAGGRRRGRRPPGRASRGPRRPPRRPSSPTRSPRCPRSTPGCASSSSTSSSSWASSPEVVLSGDLRFSDHLDPRLHHRGARSARWPRPDPSDPLRRPVDRASDPSRRPFPWEWLDPDRPHVLVSLGTVNADDRRPLLRHRRRGARRHRDPGRRRGPARPGAPCPPGVDNILVCERVPAAGAARPPRRGRLPRRATTPCARRSPTACPSCSPRSATTSRSSPTRSCGPAPGVRVRFGRVRPDELLDAVRTGARSTRPTAHAAGVIRQSFLDAGGAVAAADALEALLPVKEPA